MANPKGNKDNLTNAGKGRPKGSKNKLTGFKASVLRVYEDIGGDKAFAEWGKKNPGEFYKIIAKTLPKAVEVKGEVDLKGIEVRFVKPSRDNNPTG